MISLVDEGFTDNDVEAMRNAAKSSRQDMLLGMMSVREREDLVFELLKSLPRSSVVRIQRNIAPLLQLDVIGLLPDEVALQVYSYLPWQSLVACSFVSKRWKFLASDQLLWRQQCAERKWEWRNKPRTFECDAYQSEMAVDSDDEGMGDDEEDDIAQDMQDDSQFMSMFADSTYASTSSHSNHLSLSLPRSRTMSKARARHSAPSIMPSSRHLEPDYRLLFETHMRLQARFRSSSYNLSYLQSRGVPQNGHTNTIYCLQLYTYPDTGVQVLFTGSKDKSIREWDLATGKVTRVLEGIHQESVLSICVHNGWLASGGSDRRVVIWDLAQNQLVKVLMHHEDSVLCVRFDDHRLVTCSKDRTIRTYSMPDLKLRHVLRDHRAAVNAVSISDNYIVSASGDRSMRLWDAEKGTLLHTFVDHHGRGIASIDFKPPYVLSGSSDKHLRLLDITTSQGWCTSPDLDTSRRAPALAAGGVCETCGSTIAPPPPQLPSTRRKAHQDLVRSVSLNSDFVVSGSYDFTVKVWDRQTGALVADLAGGHVGRIFCVGFDHSKIISCGEDQRICIWDFSHGIDTSFVAL
ncbi:WD40 repeat-like protein [Cristinia sonorae]|uniref:WD40 repeat-like protein n=1 Tax=Cristinia sonorae TaxID=1940300 RepID=A0A8K0ULX6_9AGAR|nr:WD40 repeat-like protein [Cristinia sonorae]